MMASQTDSGKLMVEHVVGIRISEMRKQQGITLEQLSILTGFTKGYLSKIENSKRSPPVGSLARIAQALKTGIAELLQPARAETSPAISVVRVAERRPAVRGGTAFGYDYVNLAHTRRNKRMEPFLFTFPSEINKHIFFEHEGEEFLFVLSGKVEWQSGREKLILESGDSVYFDARTPHRGRSLGGEATALVVVYNSEPRVAD